MHAFKTSIVIIIAVAQFAVGIGCAKLKLGGLTSSWNDDEDAPDFAKVDDAPKPRISPKTHMAAGRMLERQGDLAAAIQQYQKALAFDPGMVQAYNRLGAVYQKLERFEDAESYFRKGIHANPDSAILRNNLGFCYLQQGDYAAAEGAFRAALEKSPQFNKARMNLGIALARSLRLKDSAIEFSRVVPTEAAYYNVAVICCDMEEYAHAERALRESLAANPAYAPARRQLRALARQSGNAVPPSPVIASEIEQETTNGDPEMEAAPAPISVAGAVGDDDQIESP